MSDSSKFCGIIGTAYCGSTMLSYMLGGSPDIMSTGELTKGFERYRCAPSWHGGDWTSDGKECLFWSEEFARLLNKNTYKTRNKKLKIQAKKIFNKKIVFNADKDPGLYSKSLTMGDSVDALIILFKRPQAFAFSCEAHLRNRSKKSRTRLISDACNSYLSTYKYGINFVRKNKIPHIFIQYEDLAQNPEAELERICNFLDAEYSSKMVSYWNNKSCLHMSPSGNRGAHRQFLKKEVFMNTWKNHLEPNFNDRAYHSEHARWFLNNYHKITLDEKWRAYLTRADLDYINKNHQDTLNIYRNMIKEKNNE